tara:strand:- start:2212 stop:2778 length:567 start_codon:yes stop_codon:yes gene_type:complete
MTPIQSLAAKARKARVQTKPPIAIEDIAALENAAGVKLPDEYRDFLSHVANGGTSPCRLVPLAHWDHSYWIDCANPLMIAVPSIITPEAESHGEAWLDRAAPADWSNRWDNNEWDPMFGTIAVAEIGCGLFFSLIVTGEHRGRVFSWGDHALNPPIFCEESSFTRWIEGCFDQIIAGHPVHFLDGRIR